MFVISLAILLQMKSPVASAVFWITLFEAVLNASVADFLAWSRGFWLHLPIKFLLIFLPIFYPCDGVKLEFNLDPKFQWPQEGLNCESLA